MVSSLAVQASSGSVVLRHARAVVVHQAEDGLRIDIPLVCSLAVPASSGSVVLWDASYIAPRLFCAMASPWSAIAVRAGTSWRSYAAYGVSTCAAAGTGAERTPFAGAAAAALKQQLTTTSAAAITAGRFENGLMRIGVPRSGCQAMIYLWQAHVDVRSNAHLRAPLQSSAGLCRQCDALQHRAHLTVSQPRSP